MSLFKNKYRIETTRLKGWDYANEGAYFITLVTHKREYLFGHICQGEMILNEAGHIAQQCWTDIPNHFKNTMLDAFVVMPNHIHGIIFIIAENTNTLPQPVETQHFASPDDNETPTSENQTQHFASPDDNETPTSETNTQHFAPTDNNEETTTETPTMDDNETQNVASLPIGDKLSLSGMIGNGISMMGANKNNQLPYKNKFGPQSNNMASIIRGFKIGVTNWFRLHDNKNKIWQTRYHDHIIRNEASLNKIRNYIENNPRLWSEDIFYVDNE